MQKKNSVTELRFNKFQYALALCLIILVIAGITAIGYLITQTNSVTLNEGQRTQRYLENELKKKTTRQYTQFPPFANIVDAKGRILATSIPAKEHSLDLYYFFNLSPEGVVAEDSDTMKKMAEVLKLDLPTFYQDLRNQINKTDYILLYDPSPEKIKYFAELRFAPIRYTAVITPSELLSYALVKDKKGKVKLTQLAPKSKALIQENSKELQQAAEILGLASGADLYKLIWENRASNQLALTAKSISVEQAQKLETLNFPTLQLALVVNTNEFFDRKYSRYNTSKSVALEPIANEVGLETSSMVSALRFAKNYNNYELTKAVSPEISEYLTSLKIKGLGSSNTYLRYYPAGDSAAKVTGFYDETVRFDYTRSAAQNSQCSVPREEILSRNGFGLEYLAADALRPKIGCYKSEVAKGGRTVYIYDGIEATMAEPVKSTIDIDIQNIMHQALTKAYETYKPDFAAAVLVDVKTGNVLGMSSIPTFNPNDRATIDPTNTTNQAISYALYPASTVKPFTIYAGLKNNKIKTNSLIDVRSPLRLDNRFNITDVKSGLTEISVRDVLKYSSNIATAKISLSLPDKALCGLFLDLGYHHHTGIGLVGEARGLFPNDPSCKFTSYAQKASYGYGYTFTATPIQIARAYATLGNYGVSHQLRLIDNGEENPGERVMDADLTKKVLEMMTVVAENNSAIKIPNYQVSIKTGTGRKLKSASDVDGVQRHTAYTAGVAPTSNPRFSLVVVIDGSRQCGNKTTCFGGAVAAPVWSEIMLNTLKLENVPEDKMSEDRLVYLK